MARYKFVAELYFESEDMTDALKSLGEHFLKLSRKEVSHLLDEGSQMALGEPEFDSSVDSIAIVTIPYDDLLKFHAKGVVPMETLLEVFNIDPEDLAKLVAAKEGTGQ